jgi:hypothetical protein
MVLRLCWPGVITQMYLAPANMHEGEMIWDVTAGTTGLLLGDRNYWLSTRHLALRKVGVMLLAPFRKASAQPVLGRVRYRTDTAFGQLTDRCGAKQVWARVWCSCIPCVSCSICKMGHLRSNWIGMVA